MDNLSTEEARFDFRKNPDLRSILLTSVVIICGFYVLKYLWQKRWLYICSWKMHGPTPAWPIIGNAFYFSGGTENILDNIVLLLKTYKSPMRVWLGHRLFFAIAQPKDLEIILNSALSKEQLYEFTRPVVGLGLVTAPVDRWKRHRKVILPTFNQKILNTFVDTFAEHSEILVEKLKAYAGKGVFDAFPVVSRCTLDIICETALGQQVNAQSYDCSYLKWVGRAMEIVYIRMFQVWLHPDFIWRLTHLSKELDELVEKVMRFLKEILHEKKANYRKLKALGKLDRCDDETPKRKAFLEYLIELSEEGENWTDEEILEETATINIAGSDSTGSMDSFAFIMLGMHPQYQAKVYDELHSIFGDSNRRVTTDDLLKMKYLERVIKETLRLFPVGPVIVRALHEDVKLESHTLPKGSSCVIGIIHTHRDAELWPDPLKFDPDRFLPEEAAKRHPYAYIPFSAGPRNCIGPKYAMMAMKAVISTVVRHYKISTDFKAVEDIKVKADLMIKSVHGYRIALECRRKQ